jgi:uncharacterized protein (TIGR02444 family)
MRSVRGVNKTQEAKAADAESLWAFATGLYAHEAVARTSLAAQDEAGFDVNLLLYAAWLACRGVTLTESDLERVEALCGPWQRDVVLPLRDLRRRWKQEAPDAARYAAIKAVELEAERQQFALLAALPAPTPPPDIAPAARDAADAAMAPLLSLNLATLCRYRGRDEGDLRAFADAVAAALPASVGGKKPS